MCLNSFKSNTNCLIVRSSKCVVKDCLFLAINIRFNGLNEFNTLSSKSDIESQRVTQAWCNVLPSKPSISLLIPLYRKIITMRYDDTQLHEDNSLDCWEGHMKKTFVCVCLCQGQRSKFILIRNSEF